MFKPIDQSAEAVAGKSAALPVAKPAAKPNRKWFNFGSGSKKTDEISQPGRVEGQEADVRPEPKPKDKYHLRNRKSKREGGDFLDVNLIPEDLAKHPELELPRKSTASGIIIFAVVLLIFAGYLGITWYQLNVTSQIGELEVRIKNLDTQIESAQAGKDEALALQERLGLVKDLLDHHVYWTRFFSMLEKYTITDVYYNNFAMSGQDKLVISAVAKDYQAVAEQLVALEQATDFVSSVRIDSASADIDFETGESAGVSFNINLEFKPGVFLKPVN